MDAKTVFGIVAAALVAAGILIGLIAARPYYRGHPWDWGLFGAFAGIAGFLALLGGLLPMGIIAYEQAACVRFGEDMGIETDWGMVGGCYGQVGDRMAPIERIVVPAEGEPFIFQVEGGDG